MKSIPCKKVKYETEEEAKTALAAWKTRRFYRKGKLIKSLFPRRFYKCDNCGFFHITKKK